MFDQLFKRFGLLCVEVDSSSNGFFAQLSGLVPILMHCAANRLTPHITLSSNAYADGGHGPNFLDYFFDRPSLNRVQKAIVQRVPIRRVERFSDLPYWNRQSYPSLDAGHKFFASFYPIKSGFLEGARLFHRNELGGKRALGVHFRGTDKVSEATELSYDAVVLAIDRVLKMHAEIEVIFLSTDAQPMISFCREKLSQHKVVVRNDEIRSSDDIGVHCKGEGRPYEKGVDALMNALILSQCEVLLKNMSHLSGWAKVFNPDLKVYIMNRPDKEGVKWLGFPEKEMV
ncbi:MAG TPA: hypothetical protein PLV87_11240, partial [Opitutaceae bacterium]|nr:hypothetical protein [Opitutaceae bacterium]